MDPPPALAGRNGEMILKVDLPVNRVANRKPIMEITAEISRGWNGGRESVPVEVHFQVRVERAIQPGGPTIGNAAERAPHRELVVSAKAATKRDGNGQGARSRIALGVHV